MALHPEINPDPSSLPMLTASAALRAARSSKTSPTGSVYFETGSTADGDGVGIVTGPLAAEHGGIGRIDNDGVLHPLVDLEPVKQAAQAAQAQADSVRAQAEQSAQALREQMSKVAEDADKASNAANQLAQSALDAANKADGKADSVTTTVNGHESKLSELSASLESTRKTADGALEKSTSIEASVGELSATLTRDYTPTSKADAKYAAKTELTATAEGLQSKITQTATTADSAVTTANEAKSTADRNTATISQVSKTAQGALDKASSVEQSLDGFKATVSSTYQLKGDYQPKGDYATKTELNQTADSITSSVAQTYQPKGDYATNSALSSYATKTQLEQTATSITSSVSATAKTAQSALDKASTVEQTASGLSSRISEVASTASGAVTTANSAKSTADKNTATISQVSQKADSISSTLQQVQGNLDLISDGLYNNVLNSGFEDSANGWTILSSTTIVSDQHHTGFKALKWNIKNGSISNNHEFDVSVGRTYQWSAWIKGEKAANITIYPKLIVWNGSAWDTDDVQKEEPIVLKTEWTKYTYTFTVASGYSKAMFGMGAVNTTTVFYVDDCALVDITDVKTATDTANSALSKASTVEQTLDSFKTSVSQTYQPKGDYATNSGVAEHYATKSSLEQTATGIKTDVSQKYQAKGDYATKTELNQTSTSLTAKISTAQNTANTANSTANSAKSQANNLDTLIRMDTNGVRVGKIVSGKYVGCSCLMNANGSFDVIDSDNNIVARFDSSHVTLAGGVFNVGVIGNEDLYIGAQPLNMQQYESGLVIGRKGRSALLQGYQQAVLSSVGGNVSIFGKSGVDISTGAGKLTVNGQVWDSITHMQQTASIKWKAPYSTNNLNLTRVDNLVLVNGGVKFDQSGQLNYATVSETIPLGYRPASYVDGTIIFAGNAYLALQVNTKGVVTALGNPQSQWMRATGSWLTADPMPA